MKLLVKQNIEEHMVETAQRLSPNPTDFHLEMAEPLAHPAELEQRSIQGNSAWGGAGW